ncbi:DUF1642 domain-containing protein [Listeria monocytogenes]|uniref:DUF1642 domain-containing protein n=1 Tax=Listeria TaxID=1637 RepID=UPI001907A97F|nr:MULTISPECIES: DUF1642 domain-containing protein [Listeria]MBK1965121.1 DUF1642 domain-containing protein [Listeria ivanovii subsp. londoniensis]WDE53466.1 DUF1642 domain-containing protein [Listeria monocytogenes]HEM1440057.1 DUF1642 domain-containing protein [Listeria monocytogenes]
MKFKVGDKVQFIREGSLIDGVVKEFKDCSPDMWYLIDEGCKGCKDSWIFGGHLIPLTPLPVVPQFVADAIEVFREKEYDLAVAIDYETFTDECVRGLSLDSKVRGWLWETSNQEIFARAWLDGYEVEKEPLYYVRLPIVRLNTLGTAVEGDYKYLWADQATGENNIFQSLEYPATLIQSGWKTKFTESEIKNMDTRYWAFKVPVEEVEETK